MDHSDIRRSSDREQEERLDRLEDSMKRLELLLAPISETYTTVSTLGKWTMGVLVFVSVVIGIVLSLIKLLQRSS